MAGNVDMHTRPLHLRSHINQMPGCCLPRCLTWDSLLHIKLIAGMYCYLERAPSGGRYGPVYLHLPDSVNLVDFVELGISKARECSVDRLRPLTRCYDPPSCNSHRCFINYATLFNIQTTVKDPFVLGQAARRQQNCTL